MEVGMQHDEGLIWRMIGVAIPMIEAYSVDSLIPHQPLTVFAYAFNHMVPLQCWCPGFFNAMSRWRKFQELLRIAKQFDFILARSMKTWLRFHIWRYVCCCWKIGESPTLFMRVGTKYALTSWNPHLSKWRHTLRCPPHPPVLYSF